MPERVRIQLGDSDSYVIERYEIRQSFFQGMGAFAARVGHGGITKQLLDKYGPGTPFVVWIDVLGGESIPQMTGLLDDVSAEGSAGATEVNLRGRDWLAPLHDGMPKVEQTFTRATFRELTEKVLRLAGVPDFALWTSNQANAVAIQGAPKFGTTQVVAPLQFPEQVKRLQALTRKRAGVSAGGDAEVARLQALAVQRMLEEEGPRVDVKKIVGYDVPNPLRLKPGQTFLSFLRPELDRAGLFLIAGVDEKNYILTQPSVDQAPAHRFVRRRGDSQRIISAKLINNTSRRHSHYTVYGRGGGGKDPRKQIVGEYVDEEMVSLGLTKQWSKKDDLAKTSKQAEHLARRHAAEEARNGWYVPLTIKGHTWPLLGSESRYAVPSIDTVVELDDDEYGLHEPLWIGELAMRGDGKSEGTTTDLTFFRPRHLVFGDDVLPPKAAKKKGWQHK